MKGKATGGRKRMHMLSDLMENRNYMELLLLLHIHLFNGLFSGQPG